MSCAFGGRVRPGTAGLNRAQRAARAGDAGINHLRAMLAEHDLCCSEHIVVDREDVEAALERLDDTAAAISVDDAKVVVELIDAALAYHAARRVRPVDVTRRNDRRDELTTHVDLEGERLRAIALVLRRPA